jgi:mono/diheme cytochrome c family protein
MKGIYIAMGLFVSISIVANAGETVYTTHIRPLFDRQCVACHGKDAPEHGDFKKDREG